MKTKQNLCKYLTFHKSNYHENILTSISNNHSTKVFVSNKLTLNKGFLNMQTVCS